MRLRYLLTEAARVQVCGAPAAAYLNRLCEAGLDFSDARAEGPDQVTLTVCGPDLERALSAAGALGGSAKVLRRRGVKKGLRRARGRKLLLAALALLLAAVFALSTFLWELEVSGNTTLTQAEILEAMAELGVGAGSFGLRIDNEQLRSHMQQKLGKLIWLTVRVSGSRAQVQVRERREKPKIQEEKQPGNVLAVKTGQVARLSVLEGKALVKPGDMALAGETLITGTLTDKQEETRLVHALGEVWARTWYVRSLQIPLELTEKGPDNREKTKLALKICNFRINLYLDSGISYAHYAKMEDEHRWTLWGYALPFALVRTRYAAYTPLGGQAEPEGEAEALKARLLAELREETGGAELTEARFEVDTSGGMLTVTLTAECLEQIGEERPLPPG